MSHTRYDLELEYGNQLKQLPITEGEQELLLAYILDGEWPADLFWQHLIDGNLEEAIPHWQGPQLDLIDVMYWFACEMPGSAWGCPAERHLWVMTGGLLDGRDERVDH